jgi:NADPH-dependent F420 reductase
MNIAELKVGIVGGTGKEGHGIALRWGLAGAQVTIGSRKIKRAEATARDLNRLIGINRIRFATNKDAISNSEFIVLAVPFEHAKHTLNLHRSDFRHGSILIDATVPLFDNNSRYDESADGSGSERLQPHLPQSVHLVAAFKTISAYALFDSRIAQPSLSLVIPALDCDEFIVSDSKDAKARVIEAMQFIDGLRPFDAGPLENARIIERMTALIVNLNRQHNVKTGRYRIVGL